jgi:glycyl-tRNA synthetase beta chain
MERELLLEIGTEEIPAGFLPKACAELKTLCEENLRRERVHYDGIHTYATPRRLVLHVEGLGERQEDLVQSVMGPPRSVAYDAEGKPTKAAIGFAENQGVAVEDLSVQETPKGEYACALRKETGQGTDVILSRLLPSMITALHFPKSMRWGSGSLRFARPIHWIVALYNGNVVSFELDGVRSGNLSQGHRFMSRGSFTVHNFKSYKASARERFLMIDPEERKKEIMDQISKIEQTVGGTIIADEALLDEVAHLVEFPTALCGSFEQSFLALPRPVLITAMREHQRYFSVEDDSGRLLPHFITVSNTRPKATEAIISGNERVLRARLTDAHYFFETDGKRPLASYVDDLKGVMFQEKLGTLFEKIERVEALALWLADRADAGDREVVARAARLCKADLCTEMVGEFPSLQGQMGREYALLAKEPEGVARAIREHYRPRFAGDDVPGTDAGALVSIADKLDTLVGCFGIGLVPSGSEDPYALRRQALAILTILLAKGYAVGLGEMVDEAMRLLAGKIERQDDTCRSEILEYFRGRLSWLLTTEGHRYDTVEAVLAAGFDRVPDARARAEALSRFRDDALFEPFTVVCKRAMNIIKDNRDAAVQEGLFKADAEGSLHGATQRLEAQIPSLTAAAQYQDALHAIAALRDPIDAFFDGVMVMDQDEAVRNNRLALLTRVAALVSPIADFSKIVVE